MVFVVIILFFVVVFTNVHYYKKIKDLEELEKNVVNNSDQLIRLAIDYGKFKEKAKQYDLLVFKQKEIVDYMKLLNKILIGENKKNKN